MKEKRILSQLHEFFSVQFGQKRILTKDDAKALSLISLQNESFEFVMGVAEYESGAVAIVSFGRAPKALIQIISENAPISNKFQVTFSGKKMPEIQMEILL